MKNLSAFSISMAVCGALAFASCKKDATPAELLTGVSCWKTVKSESRAAGTTTWADDTASCSTDDCTSFADGGTYTFDEGATKCDAGDPQTASGTFVLSEDGKTLTITQSGITLPFTVEELTSKKLVVTVSFIDENRTTFEAQ